MACEALRSRGASDDRPVVERDIAKSSLETKGYPAVSA